VFALDFDSDAAVDFLLDKEDFRGQFDSFTVKTARGWHLYFQYPEGLEIRNSTSKVGPGIDVRGEGGYCIVPPSIHPSGATYVQRSESTESPLLPAPNWLLRVVMNGWPVWQSPTFTVVDSQEVA
jgi:hypothetical protein